MSAPALRQMAAQGPANGSVQRSERSIQARATASRNKTPLGTDSRATNGVLQTFPKALFDERCKSAGVVVKRTISDVEGIELAKLRAPIPFGGKEYFDPMFPEAAMAIEHRGDDYIKQFLMSEFISPDVPRRGALAPSTYKPYQRTLPPRRGYKFIEYVDKASGDRYRCAPTFKDGDSNWAPGQHRCDPVKSSSARYALDYEDMVDPGDRSLWVAGTKLKVIDKVNGEVVAELTRFVWEPGFGSGATGRLPWEIANAHGDTECRHVDGTKSEISRFFVDTILIPKQGD